ncbi:MAG: DUF1592 domain-containing protein [Pirellulaceae bacterium]|nr:DUF1592 domain-containing protein [Pirellulaceae bacterium]
MTLSLNQSYRPCWDVVLRFALSILCVILLTTSASAVEEVSGQPSFDTLVKPFLATYCARCHNAEAQKGDRRLDQLDGTIADDNDLVDYQDILDQLNLSEMPPPDEKQPTDVDRKRVIRWLTRRIDDHHSQRVADDDSTVLRRLNAREYRNTVRDLLHLDLQMFDPTSTFPKDETTEHLDNVGKTLVTSGYLLSRYLTAADAVIEKAMTPIHKPEIQTWTFRDGFHQQPEIDQVHRKTNHYEHMTLYDVIGADKHEGAYGPIHAFAKGVPTDGFYEIKIKAEAVNRLHPYDDEFLGRDRNEPLRLGIRPGNYKVGKLHLPQPVEPLLAEIDLADQPKWYTAKVWLDEGYTPRFTFRNGLMNARSLWTRVIKKYPDQFPENLDKGIVSQRFNAIKHGKLPQIQIHEIEIRGPLYDQWPTDSHRAILGDDWESVESTGELTDEQIREHLFKFATRAYRRDPTTDEIDRIVQLIQVRKDQGRTTLEAFGDGLKAILCSPSFLYLDEGDSGKLSSHALASRLSYFLWASCPDDQLLSLAKSGRLSNEKILMEQVDRMLADPKSDAMIEGFLGAWLTLRDLGSAPPDRTEFGDFYQYDLGTAMREETRLFTRHLIDQNLSLVQFLDSDVAFVNKALARLYDLDPPVEPGFHRVQVSNPRRGGLLGQASVLTVTANGIDTSPVVRGVWLLENILGTPPSPPPPDVQPLDPDIRGAVTIRQQLSRHRSIASCNDCHRKIDPLGFALENFDPIGRWRETYGRNTKIDASGKLPNGMAFDDIVGLKQILLQQKQPFAKALTEKLLAFATGRTMGPGDRPAIDQILDSIREDDWPTRDLIKQIVLSEPFQTK